MGEILPRPPAAAAAGACFSGCEPRAVETVCCVLADDLIERIYEAAFIPDVWPDVLERSRAATGSASASLLLYCVPEAPPRFIATEVTRPALERFTAGPDWRGSLRDPILGNFAYPPAFVFMSDLQPPEVLDQDMVSRYLRALGLDEQLGSIVPLPTGEFVCFTYERWRGDGRHDAGAVAALNAARPHLARAAMLSARLGLERMRGAVAALEALGLPAAMLTGQGRIVAANGLLEGLDDLVIFSAHGELALADRGAQNLLLAALGTAGQAASRVTRSIPLPARDERGPFVLHLVPVLRQAQDIFAGAAMLAVLTPITRFGAPDLPLLQALFDLTPAEARLARSLAQGQSIQHTAARHGLSVTTLRSQLSAVLAKTGTARQADLTALLSTIHARTPGEHPGS